MNLTGYIDESMSKDRRLFAMSAIIAERMDWIRFEADWENCIEGVNCQLKKDGRTPISRSLLKNSESVRRCWIFG